MIITETIIIDGKTYKKTYSDCGLHIRKKNTEEMYIEAVDILAYEYEETDIPIEQEEAYNETHPE